MTRSRTEIARQSIDAWNGRNVEWLVETASPDFEFVPLIASSVEGEAGVVRGSEAFRRFFVELDETWEVFHLETEELEEVGDRVLVRSHLHAKGRGSGVELDQPLFSLLSFEGDVPRLPAGIRRSRVCAGRRRGGAKVSGALQSAIAAKGGV